MMSLDQLFAAAIEWHGHRSSLEGRERREFPAWLARVHPKIVKSVSYEPALLRHMCREVLKGTTTHSRDNGIGMATLKRHSPALVARYLTLPEKTRGTFQSFLERVLQDYSTETALKQFLG